jgi:hypothetical protein
MLGPTGSARGQISIDGGGPHAGAVIEKELYYATPGGGLMAAAVKTGSTFEAGTAQLLV